MRMVRPASGCSLNATIDPRAVMAAHNNADWYAMMADLHGLRYRRDDLCFEMLDQPPPFHSWMTTLDPTNPDAVMARVAAHPTQKGFGIKDGFDALPLDDPRMKPGFSASWIWAATAQPADTSGWEEITTPAALDAWEAAWHAPNPPKWQQFPPAILDRADVTIWGRKAGDGYDAGGIANRSSDCIGLSNVFGEGAFAPVAALAGEIGGPLVGYERGDDLVAAQEAGFEITGPLHVWFSTVH